MKKILTLLTTVVILSLLASCGDSISDRSLRKMLKENGYEYEECDVKKIYTLPKELKDFENGKNKLVLYENDDEFGYAVVNKKEKRLVCPRISYIPLDIIQDEIYDDDMNVNLRCIEIYKRYIENNGIYCFEDKAIAETYLREITTVNGVIPTTTAQNTLNNKLGDILPEAKSATAEIIFEKGSAVPMFYAIEGRDGAWTTYDTNMSIAQVFSTKEELYSQLNINDYTTQSDTNSDTQTDAKTDTVKDKPTSQKALYYVRTAFENTSSQKGEFSNLQNARVAADENATAGYKVFDIYGNLVYTPSSTKSTNTQPQSKYYYVKNETNQLGAYEVRQHAINAAESHKNEEYKVYDDSGNLIYAPQTEKQTDTRVENSSLYRVRKSATEAETQLGAYKNLESAKSEANAHKAEGYEVYDTEDNLIYTP